MRVPEPKRTRKGDYAIQLRLDGQSIYIHGSSAKECRDRARLYKAEVLADVRQVRIYPTLTNAIDAYIERRKNTLSPSTIEGYRRIQKNRFPELMSTELDARIDWQAAINQEAARCSPKTLRNAFRFLVSVYAENGISLPKISLPPLESKTRLWLEPDQIMRLVSVLDETTAFPVLFALHSLRRSELLAVTWDDIDMNRETIRVSGAIVMDENRKYIEKPTNKTQSSTRTVPIMIPALMDFLKAVPPEKRTGHLVQCNPNTVPYFINRACRRAGVPEVGTHGLRHSFASLAYHLGLSELETMRLGGWSDTQTMRKIYTHLSESDRLSAENKMKKFYQNAYENAYRI